MAADSEEEKARGIDMTPMTNEQAGNRKITMLLIQEIAQLKIDLEGRQTQLAYIQKRCQHQWGETEYVPEHQKAYTIPDQSRGSDFSPECHVPAKTTPKWQRTCQCCGLVQETKEQRTKQVVKEPHFG